jgi:hypothetical protein
LRLACEVHNALRRADRISTAGTGDT